MSYRNECKYGDSCGFDFCVPEYCKDFEPAQKTNADHIRAMTDEELAELLLDGCRGTFCDEQATNEYGSADCFQCRLNWLQQPCEGGMIG